ncbi:hypothetical protein BJ944DRAFT_87155 [Cunninghamella echinulata]|nr:hypothetical protein BJ944DRAFT_87155 [Cunninghamella echinulata]
MDSTKKKFAVTTNALPNTQITNRNDIFDLEQEAQIMDEDATKRMNELMEIVIENKDIDQSEQEENENEGEEEEEEEFTFRLFSTGSTTKVSLRETSEKEQMDYLSQQIAHQQELEFDEKDPALLEKVKQAVMNYDDILIQSTWPYPALKLPKRVITISSAPTDNDNKSIKKKKRKSKKRRDFEKAVKEGRIQLDPSMRNPLLHGPGWPYSKTPCAIINYQPSFKKSNHKGQFNNNYNNMKPQYHSSSSSFRGRGRGRGAGPARGSRGGGSFRGKITKPVSS